MTFRRHSTDLFTAFCAHQVAVVSLAAEAPWGMEPPAEGAFRLSFGGVPIEPTSKVRALEASGGRAARKRLPPCVHLGRGGEERAPCR